ncbi:MAG: inovirus-type Gp2 protein [Deltaproteobacteria bacterium]|nr:inovirus-type Gp2 protein [Deltaproteobacteria bacterium]
MRKVFCGNSYNGFELSSSEKNNEGFYREILQAIDSLFNDMLMRHGKVFFSMFVLKYPAGSASLYPNDNSLLSRFIEALSLFYKRRKVDLRYLWVREFSSTGQVHYHLILLLNGDLIQNGYGILQRATELWEGCLGIEDGQGLVHLCTMDADYARYGGIKIIRNDPEVQQVQSKCYELASYLAKCYSKGGLPPYLNGFGSSRLS